jgi:RNA-directed DNA polymerase
VGRVVELINPVLRGWVNYFAIGNSSECFSFVKDWVEKKIRRHMQRSRQQQGFGWETWSKRWLYGDTMRMNTDAEVRGGAARTSVEAFVMKVERRSSVIPLTNVINLGNGDE